jgi:hypothetical protein
MCTGLNLSKWKPTLNEMRFRKERFYFIEYTRCAYHYGKPKHVYGADAEKVVMKLAASPSVLGPSRSLSVLSESRYRDPRSVSRGKMTLLISCLAWVGVLLARRVEGLREVATWVDLAALGVHTSTLGGSMVSCLILDLLQTYSHWAPLYGFVVR